MTHSTGRREHWEKNVAVPMFSLGIAFIVAYSLLVLVPDLNQLGRSVLLAILLVSWAAFVIDYLFRVILTPRGQRVHYVVTRPVDILSVLLPVFRAIRVVHLVGNVRFGLTRGGAVRGQIIVLAVAYTVTFIYFISLATLSAERGAQDARITNFGDAIWWAFETVTTVGYGDMYPVTGMGRFYAVLLMMGGIAIVGVTSGTLVSYIGEKVRAVRPTTPSGADPAADPEQS